MKKVIFINYGIQQTAYHSSNKTDAQIKKQYQLENLKVISIEDIHTRKD